MSKEQIKDTLQAVGIPVAVFCRKVGISVAAWYAWQSGRLNLSTATTARIEEQATRLRTIMD